MSVAEYFIGDVFDVLATMPDASVDLVLTSPPFLALRSYLPADHPDKHKEIGSEPTPAEFLDTLLALTAEWERVLAPHGSIAVELGDTYSGGGGDNHLYEGSNPEGGFNGSANHGALPGRRRDRSQGGWPLDKSLCGIPTLYAWSLAYGRNLLTGEPSPAGQWRIRNVVAWCRPNPPVGALGDKFRPATSYMTIATRARDRWFDLDAVRHQNERGDEQTTANDKGGVRGAMQSPQNPAGAPPLDWWNVSTEPYSGSHYATWPRKLLDRPIKAMCPIHVCTTCGQPRRRIVENLTRRRFKEPMTPEEFGSEMVAAMDRAHETPETLAEKLGVTPWMVRHWRGETATPQLPSVDRWQELDTWLPFDHWVIDALTIVDADYENHDRGNRQVDGRLSGGPKAGDKPKVVPIGWSDCGHDTWRNGIVLDPFAGSGTTLAVATGHGRDAIGIDLDARNADLARERIGMFLTVTDTTGVVA